ncbi:hypothetical protein DKT74_19405 [Streptomyces sp. ZEA17I]|nr:hypothetical protein DKT74_19405 [Streptomyces sp. ZEA17I]
MAFPVEAQLAVGDVLDDEEPVPPGQRDQGVAALQGEGEAGGVLVVRDEVEELGRRPGLRAIF